MSASVSHDLLLPRQPGGMASGAALALLAHVLLLLALTTVVQWRAEPVEAVSAELWSAVPQQAAPPAPPPAPAAAPRPAPPPPPAPAQKAAPPAPDPQIAIAKAEAQARAEKEKQARDKAERERLDKERQRQEKEAEAKKREAEARKREQQTRAEEERLAQQRQKNLERIMGQAGSSGGNPVGSATQSAGPSASYTARLVGAIKPNIVFTDTVGGNPATEVEVRAGPSGAILSHRIVRSSGVKEWDDAVSRAIDRTGTLPRDVDGRVPPVLNIVFRPKE